MSVSKTLNHSGYEVATFAAGCFWGVEHLFLKHYGQGKGLIDAKVGYTGGRTSSPDYRTVCSDTTGHAEALQISFDPNIVTYSTLVDFFFRMHDPTQVNRQGPDVGRQYRSVIFTHNEEQARTANEVKDRMQKTFYRDRIVTEIVPIELFWDAEEYHQKYLIKNPSGYECPSHYVRTKPQV